jgi:hypothetical protein
LDNLNNENPLGVHVEDIINPIGDNNLYKPLPDKLTVKGWILNKNTLKIPVFETEYYLNIEYKKTKNSRDFSYYWSYKDNKKGMNYKAKIFLNEELTVRTTKLLEYAKANRIEVDKSFFIDPEIIDPLNEYNIEQILKENYQITTDLLKEDPEFKDRFKYKKFKDYPENVQKEAIEIIEKNEFLNYLLNSVSWKHQGDIKTAKLLLLSMATIYIKEPVHQILNAEKGKGKTDVFNRVKEVQPDQYIIDLVSFSVKSLYYGKDNILNNQYNILIIDDVKFTNDIIELLKLLLDNERKKKIHRTVIDGKYNEMELEGYFLGLINRAKDDLDSELADRCYLNSLEDNKEYKIKNRIKENNIINIDPYNERFNLILKCSYQWLIDKEIKVYNPMLLFFEVQKHERRNINHYMALSKGMTFYNYNQRKTIDGITIGSYEDIKATLNIVVDDFQVQKDKLTDPEKKVIDELENNPEHDTNKLLANALGLNHKYINELVKGRDNQNGLEAKGYIETTLEDKGSYNINTYTLLKTYKNPPNTNLIYTVPTEFIYCMSKNHLLVKQAIIINYLNSLYILINKYIEKKINSFIKNNGHSLENYNNLCLMLEDFNNFIKNDNNIIYLNSNSNITSKMFIEHNDIVKNINNEIFILLSDFQGSKQKVSKPTETVLKQKQGKKIPEDNKTVRHFRTEKDNKELRKVIQKEIYETLTKHGSLTKSNIIKYIPIFEKDPDSNYYIISKELDHLVDMSLIEKNNDKYNRVYPDFEDHYNKNLKGLECED